MSSSTAPRNSERWVSRALRLVVATAGYNVLEAGVALWSGIRAESIALVGFGLDSIIEAAAAGVLLWRLQVERRRAEAETVEAAERRVQRFVGGTFMALALYVAAQATWILWSREQPSESWLGLALAVVSLSVMPLVAFGKLRAAREIRSRALEAEAKETLACSYLSFCLLLGLATNALLDWWWADPVAALLMVPWLVKEGWEGLRSEACCD